MTTKFIMKTIDEKLEALPAGEIISISCPTPYCDGIGGKCATCGGTWSECGCMYNELNCKCGKRAEKLPLTKSDKIGRAQRSDMTTVIDGFALLYSPIEEETNEHGHLSWSGMLEPTAIQASDMPDYLQETIKRFLQEKYDSVRFKAVKE